MTTAVQLFDRDNLKTGLQLVSYGDLIGFSILVISTIPYLTRLHFDIYMNHRSTL